MTHVSFVFLTALDLEYEAVRGHLTGLRGHTHPGGTRYETGRLVAGRCRVALGLVGAGNQSAAVLAERAIAEFAPRALIFVGVAGALWEHVQLGDVVVANRVYAYHGATSGDEGMAARPRAWEISHGCDQLAHEVARSGTWLRSLPAGVPEPTVRFGPIAAGEVVQDSAVSAHAQWIRNIYNDAIAIEMEGAGVAQAGHLNQSLPVIVVRGISDRADGTKVATDDANWQPTAAANAAAFATALAGALAREPGEGGTTRPTTTRRGAVMGDTVRNIAKGNARVGIQAGRITGPVTVNGGTAAVDTLLDDVAQLRLLLERARADGEVDDDTYRAAERELDAIDDSLPPVTGQDRTTTLLSLRRLRGLLLDVAEVAAKVTAVISVVQSMS
jgi:adenosylhomocysteine nucleosidase